MIFIYPTHATSKQQNDSWAKLWLDSKSGKNLRLSTPINHQTYSPAIKELKAEGKCPTDTIHRQVKYLNNIVEADHGKLKRLIKPTLGFKSMKTAYATIKGFETMHALKKGQAKPWRYQKDVRGEVRLVERAFGLGKSAFADGLKQIEKLLN